MTDSDTRDEVAHEIAKSLCEHYKVPVVVQDRDRMVADALLAAGLVVPSGPDEAEFHVTTEPISPATREAVASVTSTRFNESYQHPSARRPVSFADDDDDVAVTPRVPSGLTAEKLRAAADIVGRSYDGGLDAAHELREWADALSTQETQ